MSRYNITILYSVKTSRLQKNRVGKYNRGHPKVNDSLRKFPYFSLDSLASVQPVFLSMPLYIEDASLTSM
jgi:hypothetical protein